MSSKPCRGLHSSGDSMTSSKEQRQSRSENKSQNTTFVRSLHIDQVHSTIVGYLKTQMPMIGKDAKKKEIIKHLDRVFTDISTEFSIPAADFPDPGNFAEKLKKMDFTKFPAYDKAMLDRVDKMLSEDFPRLMKMIPAEARKIKY